MHPLYLSTPTPAKMMNYHEMTMGEPRDSPQRRKQFLVISAIMTGIFLNAGLNAGALSTITIETGTFPGGEFVYKTLIKDYAASAGTLRTVTSDLDIVEDGTQSLSSEISETETVELDTADLMYSVFLDDERVVPGGKTRFAAGALLQKSMLRGSPLNPAEVKRTLLDLNDSILEKAGKKAGADGAHSTEIPYEVGNLPRVEAAVAQHPYTGGAWSAVLQSKKIFPRLRRHYEETNGGDGGGGVVVSTCSAKQKMCTYYMVRAFKIRRRRGVEFRINMPPRTVPTPTPYKQ